MTRQPPDHSMGDGLTTENGRWSFGGRTPEVFDTHARRSIPFYQEGHQLIARLSDFFIQEGSRCYDLGCSTGQLTISLAHRHGNCPGTCFIGIDSEAGMIDKARENGGDAPNVSWTVGDILEVDYGTADLIIAYYTVHFTNPSRRRHLMDRICQSLQPGGAFVLFEKVRTKDVRFQDLTGVLYTDFKTAQGYTEAEIYHKERGLKGILEPFSSDENHDLLKRAGFADIMTLFSYVCFEGLCAIK